MGLPGVYIPERLLADLPTVLAADGTVVTPKPVEANDARQGFVMILTCRSPQGGVVGVSVQRNQEISPDGFVVVVQPISPWRKILAADRLMRQIVATLRQRGATDLTAPRR